MMFLTFYVCGRMLFKSDDIFFHGLSAHLKKPVYGRQNHILSNQFKLNILVQFTTFVN
jgi:hypothetical protein